MNVSGLCSKAGILHFGIEGIRKRRCFVRGEFPGAMSRHDAARVLEDVPLLRGFSLLNMDRPVPHVPCGLHDRF